MTDKILAYHFDLKHGMWRQDFMRALADRLRGWGFNTILLEMEDKFRFPRHPSIAHADALSPEQAEEFVQWARAKGLDVVPLVPSLGHAEFILRKDEYAHLRVAPTIDSQFDPLSAKARQLVIDLCDEVIDALRPSRFFHVGGDEAWYLAANDRCAAAIEDVGIGELYLQHMLPILEHIHRRGLRPIIWADMLLSHPETIERVPKYVVLMDWDYWTRRPRLETIRVWRKQAVEGAGRAVDWRQYQAMPDAMFKRNLGRHAVDERTPRDGTFRAFYCARALADAGFDVLAASASRCWGDTVGVPRYGVHLPNCFYSTRAGMDRLGAAVTSWAVRHCHPTLCLPAAFAAARAFSGHDDCDLEETLDAFCRDFFGAALPGYTEAMVKAAQTFTFAEAHAIETAGRRLDKGEDAMGAMLEDLDAKQGGRNAAVAHVIERRSGYAEARELVERMAPVAVSNRDALGLYLEAIDVNTFYADVALAALRKTLAAETPVLASRLKTLREQTGRLLGGVYTPVGLAEEIDLRYGFHDRFLRGKAAGGRRPRSARNGTT